MNPRLAPQSSTPASTFKPSRRQVLQAAVASLTVPLWARGVYGQESTRVRLAGIGIGGMGGSDLGSLSSHRSVDVVALCDVDANRLQAASKLHPKAKTYRDFRVMLKEMADGIDAVHVSTPDHTHAAASVSAMNLGKHVYCQKPLTHDLYEARQMRLIAKDKGVVTQMGTQIHSHEAYRTGVKLVQSGVIGKVREVHSWSSKTWGFEGDLPKPAPVPDFLDWDLWIGTAPMRDYAPGAYHPADWRRWYDFGCGTMGDMAIHILDPVFTALQLKTPLAVLSQSSAAPKYSFGMQNHTRYQFEPTKYTTDVFQLTWSDGGKMPDTSNWPKLTDDKGNARGLPDQGSMFVGEKGYVLLPHIGMPMLLPQDQFAKQAIERVPGGDHYHLFIDACLGGSPTTAGFDYAGPLTEAVLLGTVANRFPGQALSWDAEKMQITGSDAANQLVKRTYREGFEVAGL